MPSLATTDAGSMPAAARASSVRTEASLPLAAELLAGVGEVLGRRRVVLGERAPPVAGELDRALVEPPLADEVTPQRPHHPRFAREPRCHRARSERNPAHGFAQLDPVRRAAPVQPADFGGQRLFLR